MKKFEYKKSLALMFAAAIFMSCGITGAMAQPASDSPFAAPESALDSALPESEGEDDVSPGMSLSAQDAFEDAPPAEGGPESPLSAPPNQNARRSVEDIEREIRDQAFNAALTGLLPMKPDELRRVLEAVDNTRQAYEVPVYPYPEPVVAVETVSLDPGTRPPVINVAVGHVSTLMFVDVTGEPWPIKDITWAGNFEIVEGGQGSPMLRIQPVSEFAYGNISVSLIGLDTPVLFTLKAARDKIHYRFDARIAEYGPYAQTPLIQGGLTLVAGNSVINSILDGVPPQGSEVLKVSGTDGRTTAYSVGDMTYVRTPLTLLSPGWSNSVSSSDGMNVYALSNAPVVLLSDAGQVVRAHLSEKEVSDE